VTPLPFGTTPDQLLELGAIVLELRAAGFAESFVTAADELARIDQGVFDLLALWRDARDAAERDEIIGEVWESLADYEEAPARPLQKPLIRFESLADVAKAVADYKQRLRLLIDQRGGVAALAQQSGIPEAALSRMLCSAALPRRTTIYRMAIALGLSEGEVVGEWGR
jgi:hypothetical protein